MGWRKLFGMESVEYPIRPASPVPEEPGPAFAIHRNRMLDPSLTSRLHQLFKVGRDDRAAVWNAAFFASV